MDALLTGPLEGEDTRRAVTLARAIAALAAAVNAVLFIGSVPFATGPSGVAVLVALGGELALVSGAVVLFHLGASAAGRAVLLLYALLAYLGAAIGLGSGTAGDVVGATAVVALPFLISAPAERGAVRAGVGVALAAVAVAVAWNASRPPLLALTGTEEALNHGAAVVVAVVVGGFVAYLHRSAEAAKARSEALLLAILPRPIAERLKASPAVIADRHEAVTVLFADVVGFTRFSAAHSPEEVVRLLNLVFRGFDAAVAAHGGEKVKTIGDGYMAVVGAPFPHPRHAVAAVHIARDLVRHVRALAATEPLAAGLAVRVGLHSGVVVAGVIGTRRFTYDVWGDTVNTASRMESVSTPMRITLSETTAALLGDGVPLEPRGPVMIKGKGEVVCFFVSDDAA